MSTIRFRPISMSDLDYEGGDPDRDMFYIRDKRTGGVSCVYGAFLKNPDYHHMLLMYYEIGGRYGYEG